MGAFFRLITAGPMLFMSAWLLMIFACSDSSNRLFPSAGRAVTGVTGANAGHRGLRCAPSMESTT